MNSELIAPLEQPTRLGAALGLDLYVQRDDLLPFPLAGNKVRKIHAELAALKDLPGLLITNGGVDSNHCRTTAFLAAQFGVSAHLVLHGEPNGDQPALKMLDMLKATYTVVDASQVAESIASAEARAARDGVSTHVIPGGCHSPSGAKAYAAAGRAVIQRLQPDYLFVASGTGATQGGLVAAASSLGSTCEVVGVSVARSADRGRESVREAAAWAGETHVSVTFEDQFRAGGYSRIDQATEDAVAMGWKHGLPLDPTYTGKAFAGMMAYARDGRLDGKRVLFWHTGGLWNGLVRIGRSPSARSGGLASRGKGGCQARSVGNGDR